MMKLHSFSAMVICLLFSMQSGAQPPKSSSDMLENTLSAVVTVAVYNTSTTKKSMGFSRGNGDDAYSKILDLSDVQGSGSGFIINYNNIPYIITNAHVVEYADGNINSIAAFSINRKKYRVSIVGGDSFYDIAVLRFEDTPGPEISTIKIRKEPARIGEKVYAIGNPLGEFPYSVSEGIISAKNRVRGSLVGKFGFLQTTATVIWGNSGGPLIDESGQVLGINSQIAFANNGGQSFWQPQINFALEGPLSQRLIDNIITNNGIVKRCYLGVSFGQRDIEYYDGMSSYDYYSNLSLKDDFPIIMDVLPSSPAAVLKDYIGAKVVEVNSHPVGNIEELLGELEISEPGKDILFKLNVADTLKTIKVPSGTNNLGGSVSIASSFLKKEKISYYTQNDKIYLKFSKSDEDPNNLGLSDLLGKDILQDLSGKDWELVGVGIWGDFEMVLWRIKDLSDIGTALRLTGLNGTVNFMLVEKDSDPSVDGNYVNKEFRFSDDSNFKKKILWY